MRVAGAEAVSSGLRAAHVHGYGALHGLHVVQALHHNQLIELRRGLLG